jgi:hypothetical protein
MGRVSVSSTRYTGAGSGEGITGGVERADPASEIAWDNRAQPDEAAQREFGRFEGHLVWRIWYRVASVRPRPGEWAAGFGECRLELD